MPLEVMELIRGVVSVILGEEQWRKRVCALISKAFQSTPIEYYSPFDRARAIAWLTEGL
jgi:hypothetical protein